jgi:hypothetical protein
MQRQEVGMLRPTIPMLVLICLHRSDKPPEIDGNGTIRTAAAGSGWAAVKNNMAAAALSIRMTIATFRQLASGILAMPTITPVLIDEEDM